MISDDIRDALIAHLRGHPLHELAESFGIPIPDLIAWFNSPPIADLLKALEAIADRQANLAIAHARVTAIHALESAARGAEISESEIRASSTLLRNTPKSPHTRRNAQTSRDAEPRLATDHADDRTRRRGDSSDPSTRNPASAADRTAAAASTHTATTPTHARTAAHGAPHTHTPTPHARDKPHAA